MSLSQYQIYYAVSASTVECELIGVRICEDATEVRKVLAEMLTDFPLCQISIAEARFEKSKVVAWAGYNSEKQNGEFNMNLLS